MLTAHVITGRHAGRPSRLLVLLHGYGATEHDVTALGPLLDPAGRCLVAGIRGPVSVPEGGHAWFDYGPMGPDADSFDRAAIALHGTIDQLCAEHLMGRDEVVLCGFSQGAAMSLAIGLGASDHLRPAGVLCLSGYLPDVRGVDYDWAAASAVPVLVQHGTHDDVVPLELGRDSASALEHHGVPVTFLDYDIGHQTTLESLGDARAWLTRVLDGEVPSAPVAG